MQGQWGGSILDSVVGVFLTQNVSDALSSKAFMNLAATFPLPEGDRKEGTESMDWGAVHTAPVEKVGCVSTIIITPLFEEIAVADWFWVTGPCHSLHSAVFILLVTCMLAAIGAWQ